MEGKAGNRAVAEAKYCKCYEGWPRRLTFVRASCFCGETRLGRNSSGAPEC